jgi:hypothetical protein
MSKGWGRRVSIFDIAGLTCTIKEEELCLIYTDGNVV